MEQIELTINPIVDITDYILKRKTEKMPGTLRRYSVDRTYMQYMNGLEKTRKGLISEEDFKKINSNPYHEEEPITLISLVKKMGKLNGIVDAHPEKYGRLQTLLIREAELDEILSNNSINYTNVESQRDELAQLSYEQARIIEEKNRDIRKLQKQNAILEEALKEIKQQFENARTVDDYDLAGKNK